MDYNISLKDKDSSQNILELFENKEIVKICAPMVRYSKVQFRNLVKHYNCDLVFTPMILADSFCKSAKARNNEFTTNSYDSPLITQFAANTVHDFVGAAHMVSPFCNGVDLNCGCPQTWAKRLGVGCVMLQQPQLIYEIVRECRNRIAKPFTVSVKMRIRKDIKKSVEICRQLEKCGVSFLTVHSRTSDQITGDINLEALNIISESVGTPVVANGGVKSLEECFELKKSTKCKGVMVANGLLTNPTLFTGSSLTPLGCVQRWLDLCYNSTLNVENYVNLSQKSSFLRLIPVKPSNLTFQCFHHHLVFMLEKILTRKEKRIFNNLQNFESALNFIREKFGLSPRLFNKNEFERFCILDSDYKNTDSVYFDLKPNSETDSNDLDLFYDHNSDGTYFKNKIEETACDWSDMFIENG